MKTVIRRRQNTVLVLLLVIIRTACVQAMEVRGDGKPPLTLQVQERYQQLERAIMRYNRDGQEADKQEVIDVMNLLGPLSVYCRCAGPCNGRCNESEVPPALFRILRTANVPLAAAVLDALAPVDWGQRARRCAWRPAEPGNAATLCRWRPWRSLLSVAVFNTPVLRLLLERTAGRLDEAAYVDVLCDATAADRADSVGLLVQSGAVSLDAVTQLLRRGAVLNNARPAWEQRCRTPLLSAARRGCARVFAFVLSRSDLEATTPAAPGLTPLCDAVTCLGSSGKRSAGDPAQRLVRLLLARGADMSVGAGQPLCRTCWYR